MQSRLFNILTFLIIAGCGDDPNPRVTEVFAAEINGQPWLSFYPGGSTSFSGNKNQFSSGLPCNLSYSLNLTLFNNEKFKRLGLSIDKIQLSPGKFPVTDRVSYRCEETDPAYADLWTITDDGDVLENQYDLLPAEDNFIEVTSYDDNLGVMEGTFQLNFVVYERSGASSSVLPDTVRFANVTFRTRFEK